MYPCRSGLSVSQFARLHLCQKYQGNFPAGHRRLLGIVCRRGKSDLDLRKRRLVVDGRRWLSVVSAGLLADQLRTGDVNRAGTSIGRRCDPRVFARQALVDGSGSARTAAMTGRCCSKPHEIRFSRLRRH